MEYSPRSTSFILVERLLEWEQLILHSLRPTHVPGKLLICHGAMCLQMSECSIRRQFRKSRRSLARQRSISSPQKPTLIAQLIIRRTCLAQHSPLRFYPDRTDPYGNKARPGKRTQSSPVTKQRLYRWIVDAITLTYSSLCLQCPIGV